MHRPTKKIEYLRLNFFVLIRTIVVSDTFISDHRMITVETNIPVHGVIHNRYSIHSLINLMFLIFTKLTGPIFCFHFKLLTGWPLFNQFHHLRVLIILLTLYYHKCMYHGPTKHPSKTKISKFHRKRKISMRKRTKLRKMSSTKSITKVITIEQAICDSHFK